MCLLKELSKNPVASTGLLGENIPCWEDTGADASGERSGGTISPGGVGAGQGTGLCRQSTRWTSVLAAAFSWYLCSAQCTAAHGSPALSDDSLGKRTEESATMCFARHPLSSHIRTHLLSCRLDIYLGGRGRKLPTS